MRTTTSASADEYIGHYYMPRSGSFTRSGRYEPLKLVQTPKGWRVICINHWQWPKQSTGCFSISLRQLNAWIAEGRWVQDFSLDPDLRVSEGL